MKRLISIVTIIIVISFSTPPCFAGWQADISTNQNRAIDYISELTYNSKAKWPRLIEAKGWQGKRAYDECVSAMIRAKKMAAAGRPDLIQIPVFQYGPGQRGWGK